MSFLSKIMKGIQAMLTGLDGNNVIDVNEFEDARKNDKNIIVVDVRNPDELVGPLGQIENVINIPLNQLSSRIEELEKYRENVIAVICQSGGRSMMATKMLLDQGFKAVNVSGGMIQYRAAFRN